VGLDEEETKPPSQWQAFCQSVLSPTVTAAVVKVTESVADT
jgi:hypothetical protein